MKKIFLAFIAVASCMTAGAQDFDIAAITQANKNKADSLSTMMGKAMATQAAMNHTTAQARQLFLKGFNDVISIDNQDEAFKEGNSIATEFYKTAESMKQRNGIEMSRKAFAQALLENFNDTTRTINNQIAQQINAEAKRFIDELTALHKDSTAAATKASLIALKSDSLSSNMGQFYGLQMRFLCKQKKRDAAQIARLLEGFNSAINIDDSNKALIDGRTLATEFMNMEQGYKKQLGLTLNKDLFTAAATTVLNDTKTPTLEEYQVLNERTSAYAKETQAFVKENGPEALAQKGLGKKYIENIMEKDSAYVQAPSGLVYKILNNGNGKKFAATDKIKVMYKGTHVDGTTFDESKQPVSFSPSQVVPGFREALLMMSPGAKMIAVMPYNLAYGARGAGKNIKPYETLVFEIETIGIDDAAPAAKPAQPAKNETTTKATAGNKTTKATTPAKKTSKKATGKSKKTAKRKK